MAMVSAAVRRLAPVTRFTDHVLARRRPFMFGARSLSLWSQCATLDHRRRHHCQQQQQQQQQQQAKTRHTHPCHEGNQQFQTRNMSSSLMFWGYSAWILQVLHADGAVPYWACFALLNILVRTCLFPLVIYGAHTAARFGKVTPEVQFLVTLYQQDSKRLREQKAGRDQHLRLLWIHFLSLSRLYQKYQVNPFSVFLSPLLQIPIFWYVSVDLRKIVNGLDPALAQALVDSNVAWVADLTEPDPWCGLPVLAGVMLYLNMEVALGRRSLAGAAAGKANMAVMLKDAFQCLAVFMPCFTSAMPAGIQIYVCTTFGFTMLQSELLRAEAFRSLVGLPPLTSVAAAGAGTGTTATTEMPKYAAEFIRIRQLEEEAIRIRGTGPLLGRGVLDPRYQGSFPGTNRPSTIQGSGIKPIENIIKAPSKKVANTAIHDKTTIPIAQFTPREEVALDQLPFGKLPFIHGVSAPISQQQEQAPLFRKGDSGGGTDSGETVSPDHDTMVPKPNTGTAKIVATDSPSDEDLIEKANRGERPVPIQFVDTKLKKTKSHQVINMKRFQQKTSGKHKKLKTTKKR